MIDPVSLRQAIEHLFFGYRAFTQQPDRILERRGLGRVHHRILYFVGRRPGLSVTELLATLAVSKQAINAPLRLLVETNLITAASGPADRRVKQLSLSPAGAALEAELTGVQMRHLRDAFDAAGADSTAGWLAVMDRLAGAMAQHS